MYQITKVAHPTKEEIQEAVNDGWELYAVIPETHWTKEYWYFKKEI